MTTKLASFESALARLVDAYARPPQSDLERDGAIQRFEYCVELSWKAIREHLIELGRPDVSASPKPLYREAVGEGLIPQGDLTAWFGFIEARNLASHIYKEEIAQRVHSEAAGFPAFGLRLHSALVKGKST